VRPLTGATTTGRTSTPHNHPAPKVPDDRSAVRLHTPAQAAELLAVKESWLRRKAGQRLIPSTMLGKHLRFSDNDLQEITQAGARPATRPTRRPRTHRSGSEPGRP
jgi:excisionase family DNA binding protein